jgi:DNA-3-methyladenine glycosylase
VKSRAIQSPRTTQAKVGQASRLPRERFSASETPAPSYDPLDPLHTPLPSSFYGSTADVVAPELLGHLLIRNTPQGPCAGLIVETEAYLADDPACHAFGGRTERNRAMFGPPGRAYVYLIYGMHYCVNAVCRPRGVGEAVLIRALEPTLGLELMRARRPVKRSHDLTNGPAKLCAALGIERDLDETDLCDAASELFIARNPDADCTQQKLGPIARGPRIGITKAAAMPLRFFLKRSGFVSRR